MMLYPPLGTKFYYAIFYSYGMSGITQILYTVSLAYVRYLYQEEHQ